MSDPLTESAERLFALHCTKAVVQAADSGAFPQALWDAVAEAGFTAALLPEDAGGFGATPSEAMAILQVAAFHAAPIPLAETMLAGWLLAAAGLPVPPGPLTLAPVRPGSLILDREGTGWRLRGTASRIPWGRRAAIAVLVSHHVALVPAQSHIQSGARQDANLAGEPRDTLAFDLLLPEDAVAPAPFDGPTLHRAGAAVRTVQIAGALARALALSVDYAQTRVQFGRTIGKFQAVQHNLAVMAGQAAAAQAAAGLAAEALGQGLPVAAIAAAKSRAGEAASIAAGIAHGTHGAIGFTRDYDLHHATRRLWSWREEFGNEAEWNAVLGRVALAAGADALWPTLAAAG